MNSAGSLNSTLRAIGGAGFEEVKLAFTPGAVSSVWARGASLTVAPAANHLAKRPSGSPLCSLAWLVGQCAPPLLPRLVRAAVSARRIRTSWSKTHLDWLNTECRGKRIARLGAGWDLGQETLDILGRDSKSGSSPLDIRLLELNSPLMAKEHRTSSTLQPIAGYSMRERVDWRDDIPARISLAPICNLNRPSCVAVS